MDPNAEYLTYLRSLDVVEFAMRVEAFWASPRVKNSEVLSTFLDVVAAERLDNKFAHILQQSLKFPAGTTMWRVRQMTQRDGRGTVPGMNRDGDVWEAPSKVITARGRLNDAHESILYTSVGDPMVAMREGRVPTGGRFALIRYQTTRPVTLTSIAPTQLPAWLPSELVDTHRAVTAFYQDVFTREYVDDDWTYVLSNRIAKDWFDLPESIVDGWSFPSIAHGKGVNAAFRPAKAHAALEVVGVAHCEALDSALLGPRISATVFSPGPEGARNFRWFPMGSQTQTDLFPEFQT